MECCRAFGRLGSHSQGRPLCLGRRHRLDLCKPFSCFCNMPAVQQWQRGIAGGELGSQCVSRVPWFSQRQAYGDFILGLWDCEKREWRAGGGLTG